MTGLRYIDTTDGTVLDEITLVDEQLRFSTGVARDMFEAGREQAADRSDRAVFEWFAAGWSNGYAQLKPTDPGQAAPA